MTGRPSGTYKVRELNIGHLQQLTISDFGRLRAQLNNGMVVYLVSSRTGHFYQLRDALFYVTTGKCELRYWTTEKGRYCERNEDARVVTKLYTKRGLRSWHFIIHDPSREVNPDSSIRLSRYQWQLHGDVLVKPVYPELAGVIGYDRQLLYVHPDHATEHARFMVDSHCTTSEGNRVRQQEQAHYV